MVVVLGLFTLVPLYIMVTSSIKPLGDVQGDFHWWPTHLTIQPFIDIWHTVPLARYFANSLVVCAVATVFSVIIATFAAYAISRYLFRGRRLFTGAVLSTQMFPGILFLLPLFLIFVNIDKQLGFTLLYQTRFGLILTYLTFTLPFSIWMLASYLDGHPARPRRGRPGGRRDGARCAVPGGPSGGAAGRRRRCCLLVHDRLGGDPLRLADDQRPDRTLSIGLQNYATQINVYWNQVMAASLVVSVPS